jgi:hypothetical protein
MQMVEYKGFKVCWEVFTKLCKTNSIQGKVIARWWAELLSWNWGAAYTMLLCLLPNLNSTSISSMNYNLGSNLHVSGNTICNHVLDKLSIAKNPRSALQNLRTVVLEGDPVGLRLDSIIITYLALPTVRIFSARKIIDKTTTKVAIACPLSQVIGRNGDYIIPLNVEDILPQAGNFKATSCALNNSWMNHDTLMLFIRNFKALSRFEYEHGDWVPKPRWVTLPAKFVPAQILECLKHSKGCLEELVLIDSNRNYLYIIDHIGYDTSIRSIGSMKEFEKLRLLRLSEYILIGERDPIHEEWVQSDWDINRWVWQRESDLTLVDPISDSDALYINEAKIDKQLMDMPPNLEDLYIYECTALIYPYVVILLHNKEKYAPRLQHLILVFSFTLEAEEVSSWMERWTNHNIPYKHMWADAISKEGEREYFLDSTTGGTRVIFAV